MPIQGDMIQNQRSPLAKITSGPFFHVPTADQFLFSVVLFPALSKRDKFTKIEKIIIFKKKIKN